MVVVGNRVGGGGGGGGGPDLMWVLREAALTGQVITAKLGGSTQAPM